MSNSRTSNSISNSIFGILSYFITFIFAFVSRKVFSLTLGSEFLGLNSFFSNIVSMLTITELGLSTAIIFFLYDPISKNNKEKIKSYIFFSKKIYMIIAVIISIIGVVLAIFIDVFAETTLDISIVRIYFLLYLSSTIATYFYAYKKSILYADQKNRIIAIVHTISKIIFEITQMIVVYITKNYYFYLILLIVSNIFENYLCSRYIDKHYGFLKDEKIKGELSKYEKKDLYIKTKNLFIQNISSFIVTSTDNIVISSFINVVSVGIYSNYALLTSTLKTIFSQIFSAFTTSYGNLAVSESKEKAYIIFKNAYFFSFWFSSITGIMYLLLIQPFIKLWLGDNYLFNYSVPILLAVSYYVINMNIPAVSVQNAVGLHHIDRYIMIFQAIFNIVFSILFVQLIGLQGVILATILSTVFFPTISKPYVVYKYVFKKNVIIYYKEWILEILIVIVTFLISFFVVNYAYLYNYFISFLLKAILSFIIPNFIYYLLFRNRAEYIYFKNLIIQMLRK